MRGWRLVSPATALAAGVPVDGCGEDESGDDDDDQVGDVVVAAGEGKAAAGNRRVSGDRSGV